MSAIGGCVRFFFLFQSRCPSYYRIKQNKKQSSFLLFLQTKQKIRQQQFADIGTTVHQYHYDLARGHLDVLTTLGPFGLIFLS